VCVCVCLCVMCGGFEGGFHTPIALCLTGDVKLLRGDGQKQRQRGRPRSAGGKHRMTPFNLQRNDGWRNRPGCTNKVELHLEFSEMKMSESRWKQTRSSVANLLSVNTTHQCDSVHWRHEVVGASTAAVENSNSVKHFGLKKKAEYTALCHRRLI